jgi:hypothetical protein
MFKAEDFSAKTNSQVAKIILPLGDKVIKMICDLSEDQTVIELAAVSEMSPLTIAERLFCSATGYALSTRPGVTQPEKAGHASCFMTGLGYEVEIHG